MKRLVILAAAGCLASPAGVFSQQALRESATVSRTSVQQTRTWYEAGTPVELRSVDRGSRTVKIGVGAADQTLVIEKGAEAGFDALAAGGPVMLFWRFNRAAQPEAVLRVLTERGPVTMVGRLLQDATRSGMARR